MIMKKLAAIVASTVLVALAAGCSSNDNTTTTTTTTTTRNENGVVTTNTNTNTNINTNTNTANTNTRKAPTREEYEKNKETYEKEAKGAGGTIGSGLNDGWLWTKTRYDLLAADDLRDSTINVDVTNAVITLKGSVASTAQKAKAEQIAKSVEGNKGVHNMLTIKADNTNANNANHNANANMNHNTNMNRNANH